MLDWLFNDLFTLIEIDSFLFIFDSDDASNPSTPSGTGSLPNPKFTGSLGGISAGSQSPASPKPHISKRLSDSQLHVPVSVNCTSKQPVIAETGEIKEKSGSHTPLSTPASTPITDQSR